MRSQVPESGMKAILDAVEPIETIARHGLLLILSSPSGAGKTTLSRRLIAADPGISLSISATTRAPRPGEVEGRDYHFVSAPAFDRLAAGGALLEHAEVFGNRYGTPKAPVMEVLDQGRDVLFDVDWQGAQQIREAMGGHVVSVFILPPSLEALEERLRARASDDDATVRRRMAKARDEMSHWGEYSYVLVNQDLDHCCTQLAAILAAERLRLDRRRAGLKERLGAMGA